MAETVVLRNFAAPIWLDFEPVGYKFRQHVHQMVNGFVTDHNVDSDEEGSDDNEDETGAIVGGVEVDPSSLDPTQWKDQDHYAILGISKQRYKASPKEIRKAYQQQALQHHPDKQEEQGDDTMFKCIQMAYEILSNPKKRRGYDSVDSTFVETIPKQSASNSGDQFYSMFGPVFESNARWSNVQPVPTLGGPDADIEYVESFYSFWYNFNSWREFSYLDEENTDKAENREERRWMEKQNKGARQKRKKEETIRIRNLVDNGYACDPRIKKYKELERNKKEAQKRAKEEALKEEARKKDEERKKKEEEERLAREKVEEEERRVQLQQKQEREAAKKALKKERKQLRNICKENKYFSSNEAQTLERMQHIELLCEALTIDNLSRLNEELSGTELGGAVIDREVAVLREREAEGERRAEEMRQKALSQKEGGVMGDVAGGNWSRDELQLLIKAVNLYPAGTSKRWQVIAEYINQHSKKESSNAKTAEQVVTRVKLLKKLDNTERETENKKAFDHFKKQQVVGKTSSKPIVSNPTERDVNDVPKPWTAEEQKQLEGALRTFPSTTPKRWDRIAEVVPTRSKEECMKRFKELVAKIKSKKQ